MSIQESIKSTGVEFIEGFKKGFKEPFLAANSLMHGGAELKALGRLGALIKAYMPQRNKGTKAKQAPLVNKGKEGPTR